MSRILVIDSDEPVAHSLCVNLRTRQYDAQAAATGGTGLDLAGRFGADAVLLGLDLPDMSGLDVISGLRGWSTVPIIATSQQSGELDKIIVLDAGADDYLTKPFGMGELLARLRALLRRSQRVGEEPCVITEDFTIDLAARRVTTVAGDVHLTSTEWRLVEVLVRNSGKVVTQKALLQEVWGPSYGTETQYLRVYLKQIRSKLEPTPCRPRYFLTHRGLGLRFSNDDANRMTVGDASSTSRSIPSALVEHHLREAPADISDHRDGLVTRT